MQTYNEFDDKKLFKQISENDEIAFRELFARYAPKLNPFINGIVKSEAITEEILQDVFLRIWIKRNTLTDIEKPSSWIYRIASNLSISHFRRQRLEKEIVMKLANSSSLTIADDFSFKELKSLIHQATSQLPKKRREIFRLSREAGLSRKEIAETLNISENTVKNQLAIALKFIQIFIDERSNIYIPAFLIMNAFHVL